MGKRSLGIFIALLIVGMIFHATTEGFAMAEKPKKESLPRAGQQTPPSLKGPKDAGTVPPTVDSLKGARQCGLPQNEDELKKLLTPEQYEVMRRNGTEAPFRNQYWNNHKQGLYVDRITGEALFSSADKFDSGTGWPSFTRPVDPAAILEKNDGSHGISRIEARAKKSDSHLGHIFDDGPQPSGLRYCINSASLRFIPVEDLEKEGYKQYLPLFTPGTKRSGMTSQETVQTATFAAGCFWGVEYAFRKIPGVLKTTVGYTGGRTKNPTYEQVCSHTSGHAEAVQVEFDPSKVSYEKLLEAFWAIHDPTTVDRQGPDIGSNYRSAIFYNSPEQEKEAKALKEKLGKSGKFKRPIVTEIAPAAEFYKAEDYHQQYFEKNGMKPQCHLPKD